VGGSCSKADPRQKVWVYLKNKEDWRYGSSGRVLSSKTNTANKRKFLAFMWFSYMTFIMFRCLPSKLNLWDIYNERMLNFVMLFSVSIETCICLLSFILLMWYIMFIDFLMLEHFPILGMDPTFSWWMWCNRIQFVSTVLSFFVPIFHQCWWPAVCCFCCVFVWFWS
jgi:hypothetical protein